MTLYLFNLTYNELIVFLKLYCLSFNANISIGTANRWSNQNFLQGRFRCSFKIVFEIWVVVSSANKWVSSWKFKSAVVGWNLGFRREKYISNWQCVWRFVLENFLDNMHLKLVIFWTLRLGWFWWFLTIVNFKFIIILQNFVSVGLLGLQHQLLSFIICDFLDVTNNLFFIWFIRLVFQLT